MTPFRVVKSCPLLQWVRCLHLRSTRTGRTAATKAIYSVISSQWSSLLSRPSHLPSAHTFTVATLKLTLNIHGIYIIHGHYFMWQSLLARSPLSRRLHARYCRSGPRIKQEPCTTYVWPLSVQVWNGSLVPRLRQNMCHYCKWPYFPLGRLLYTPSPLTGLLPNCWPDTSVRDSCSRYGNFCSIYNAKHNYNTNVRKFWRNFPNDRSLHMKTIYR